METVARVPRFELAKDGKPPGLGLQIRSVQKTFRTPEGGELRALNDVSLDIAPGEFFVLLGPSGCGKTTLLRSVAGLETLDGGEIWLDGERLDQTPAYKRKVNTVFQGYALFPHLSVADNIAFGLQMDGVPKSEIRKRVESMLALVQLQGMGARSPAQLSGGQQQRVALARALAKEPRVLLLDEPLAALDLKLRRAMQAELKSLQRRTGITFLFVTHDQEEALSMGDRIAVFRDGRLAQVASADELYRRPADRFVADFIGETNLIPARVQPGGGYMLQNDIHVDPLLVDDGDQSAPVPHSTVTLAVRPESLSVTPVESSPFKGVVRDVSFHGGYIRINIELDRGTTVRVHAAGLLPGDAPLPGSRTGVLIAEQALRRVEP